MPVTPAVSLGKFTEKMDPHDEKEFTISFSDQFTVVGSSISALTFTLSSEAIAGGMEIFAQSNDAYTATVYLKINTANRSDAIYDPPGAEFSFKVNVADNASPQRRLEGTYALDVVQR